MVEGNTPKVVEGNTSQVVEGGPQRVVLAVLAAAALVCAAVAAFLPAVPDHAYQFWMGGRILDGARMYIDVGAADMHPPLFTWSATALTALSRPLGVEALHLYPGLAAAATLGLLALAWRLGMRNVLLLAVAVLALFPFAGPFFAQGEHLALACALPYLVAAVAEERRPRRPLARVAVALLAAFGLAMKPYFALVWVGVELYRARGWGAGSLVRLENLVIGGAFLLYVVATAFFTPEFFRILPWLAALYPRYAPAPLSYLVLNPRVLLLVAALAAARLVPLAGFERRFADVLSITALAMYAAVLAQDKGWGYHWYPVQAVSLLLLALAASGLSRLRRPQTVERPQPLEPVARVPGGAGVPRRHLLGHVAAVTIAVAAVAWMPFQIARTRALLDQPPGQLTEMAEVVERFGGGGSIVAYSHYLHAGFPLVNVTGTDWAAPYGHLWMVPAMYHGAWYRGAPLRYGETGRWRALEQEILDRLWEAVEEERPELVLMGGLEVNGFSTRRWLELDPRFAGWLAASSEVARVGGFTVLRPPP